MATAPPLSLSRQGLAKVKTHRLARKLLARLTAVYPEMIGLTLPEILARTAPERYSVDYTTVRWHGRTLYFSANQAAVVRVLREAREHGCPRLRQAAIQEAASTNGKLVSLFKLRGDDGVLVDHDAIGWMIFSDAKGNWWLDVPPPEAMRSYRAEQRRKAAAMAQAKRHAKKAAGAA